MTAAATIKCLFEAMKYSRRILTAVGLSRSYGFIIVHIWASNEFGAFTSVWSSAIFGS